MLVFSIILILQANFLFASFYGKQGKKEISELSLYKTNYTPLMFTQDLQNFNFMFVISSPLLLLPFKRDKINIIKIKEFTVFLISPLMKKHQEFRQKFKILRVKN